MLIATFILLLFCVGIGIALTSTSTSLKRSDRLAALCLFLLCFILALGSATESIYRVYADASQVIRECELTLPRTQNCKLTAIPEEE